MAQLNFPDNPINGQVYPDPCPAGVTQYMWDSSTGIWRIVGVATGVNPGIYGDEITVGQFQVDAAGKLTYAKNVPIRSAGIGVSGIVPLTSNTNSVSVTSALSAAGGKALQDQIGNLGSCIVPQRNTVVDALNYLQQEQTKLQTDAMIWCGYYNAQEGDIQYVSITGRRLGYEIGQELPLAGPSNGGDFFIVTVPGNPFIAGDNNAPDKNLKVGQWVISETTRWSDVISGTSVTASDVSYRPVTPLTATNVQDAINQTVSLLRGPGGGATISDVRPVNPYPGQLWWNDDDGLFYIYYRDINSAQWVEIGGGGSTFTQGGAGGVYLVDTGPGLSGGPITSEGIINLLPATREVIGGIIVGDNLTITAEGVLSAEAAGASTILAGTYSCATGVVLTTTPQGFAAGFRVGQQAPLAEDVPDNYYLLVTEAGQFAPPYAYVPPTGLQAGDWFINENPGDGTPARWVTIDFPSRGGSAADIVVSPPIPGIDTANTVQEALEAIELQVQDRVEFCEVLNGGMIAEVTAPEVTSNDGTTLILTTIDADVDVKGMVTLTNDLTGSSTQYAPTQFAISQLVAQIASLKGASVLAGTYDSARGIVLTTTNAGAPYLQLGQQAPPAAALPDNFYLLVTVAGQIGPPGAAIPATGIQSGDWFIVQDEEGTPAQWVTIDFENNKIAAINVDLAPIPGLTATNVQTGIEQVADGLDSAFTDIRATGSNGIDVNTTPAAPGGRKATLQLLPATSTDLGGVFVQPNQGILLGQNGSLNLDIASPTRLGGIKVGANLTIEPDGTLNATGGGGGGGVVRYLDDISNQFDGVKKSFLMTSAGEQIFANTIDTFISLGNVLQSPFSSYTIEDGYINFSEAPVRQTRFTGRAVYSLQPSNATAIEAITFELPLTGGTITSTGIVGINEATRFSSGAMSAADKDKLDNLPDSVGVTQITAVSPLTGGIITGVGAIGLPDATPTAPGAMSAVDKTKVDKVGSNGFGNKTVSINPPTGGDDGDIWYVV